MGREIRRVPVGWVHPRDDRGAFIPMFDQTYDQALAEWQSERDAFPADDAARAWAADGGTFEEWASGPPDPAWYRPSFDGDAVLGWCFYECTSEGTPLSPIFAEPEALLQWLVDEHGYEPAAAAGFMVRGSAPSFICVGGVWRDGVSGS